MIKFFDLQKKYNFKTLLADSRTELCENKEKLKIIKKIREMKIKDSQRVKKDISEEYVDEFLDK